MLHSLRADVECDIITLAELNYEKAKLACFLITSALMLFTTYFSIF